MPPTIKTVAKPTQPQGLPPFDPETQPGEEVMVGTGPHSIRVVEKVGGGRVWYKTGGWDYTTSIRNIHHQPDGTIALGRGPKGGAKGRYMRRLWSVADMHAGVAPCGLYAQFHDPQQHLLVTGDNERVVAWVAGPKMGESADTTDFEVPFTLLDENPTVTVEYQGAPGN